MSFNVNQALSICTANLAQRKSKQAIAYKLHYSNGNDRVDGTMRGSTIKKLIEEFRNGGGNYRYAFITKINDNKVLRFYDREISKKFFSMTRTKKQNNN